MNACRLAVHIFVIPNRLQPTRNLLRCGTDQQRVNDCNVRRLTQHGMGRIIPRPAASCGPRETPEDDEYGTLAASRESPMRATIPEFGEQTPGQVYRPRPAAYAVVTDAHRRVAIVLTPKGYFLPGGGIETGETAEEALVREVREECGRSIHILGRVGEATEYAFAEGKGYFAIRGVFFRVSFGDSNDQPAEADHELVWFSGNEAKNRLTRKSHVWAVAQVLSSLS